MPAALTHATTVTSPLEALERDEILRTRRFCLVGSVIAVVGVIGALMLPGDPFVMKLFVVAVGLALLGLLFLFLRTRDLQQFRRPSTNLAWVVPGICATTAVPFFGSFSPVIRDQIVVQLLVQSILLATLVTARMSRRATLFAFGELEQAVRLAAHREALLLEAREELERALRPGRGRFSEQSLGGYMLGEVLGRGAMGEVYEAQGKDGIVAVKVLSQASLHNPNHVQRFLRELRTAASVVSPHVARVIEVGERPVPYLVMEKLDGQSLSEILRSKRSLSRDEAQELVHQVGLGITAAAKVGVIHRDLKPQNIFHDRGTWKVLDFGVSRVLDQSDTLTKGDVVGTPTYMAPEQARGETVDHRSDLYALAAIMYRAITGQPPYAGGEVAETLYRVVHTRPRRPSTIADVPDQLDLVLAIGMARDPEKRFATAGELTAAIADAFAGTLPETVAARGRALDGQGWTTAGLRATTAPIRLVR